MVMEMVLKMKMKQNLRLEICDADADSERNDANVDAGDLPVQVGLVGGGGGPAQAQ